MTRLASLFVVPFVVLAGCTGAPASPGSAQAATPTAASQESPAQDGTAAAATPEPLPTIPPRLPNEVIRGTFAPTGVASESAVHAFSGQPVAVHVLCATYEGAVEVVLTVDGDDQLTNTSACDTPHVIVEDDTIAAGSHDVTFQIFPSGGAEGVVYLVEGDI